MRNHHESAQGTCLGWKEDSQPQSGKAAPPAYPPNAARHQTPPQQQYPLQEPNSNTFLPQPRHPPRDQSQLPPRALDIRNVPPLPPPPHPPSYEDVVNTAPTAPPAEKILP
ncbi:hypothetical protein ACTXT7_016901 [Hymenolepis weldensis]